VWGLGEKNPRLPDCIAITITGGNEMIDIMKFCSKKARRDKTNKPFTVDGFTYATNGHLVVKVPEMLEFKDNGNSGPGRATTMKEWTADVAEWFPCPVITEILDEPCKVCGGIGRAFVCPECDFAGMVELKTKFSDYESQQCETCGGYGQVTKEVLDPLKKKFPSVVIDEGDCEQWNAMGTFLECDGDVLKNFTSQFIRSPQLTF
jgi:predicted RNA-binding Zn-ribbon protein involved in translation (DUF1610 family)